MYYRQNVLRSSEFSIILKEPVPQQNKHENCEWYFASTTREQSELILSQMPKDGSFLVRPSDKGVNTYVISFK
jgi:phosphatidylinositol phospholipase C, gamma-1